MAWRLRVQPRWGKVPITEISHSDVKGWIAALNAEFGASVVIRTYGVLASVLDDAVHDRRLSVNPARGGKMGLPRKIASRHVYLTHTQVEQLAAASGEYGTLIRTLAYTGLRWAEAIGLRAHSVDLTRSRIWVVQNAVEVGGQIIEGTPKSHKIRHVPMPSFLREEIRDRIADLGPDDLVFPSRAGDFMKRVRNSKNSKSWFKNAAAAAGAPRIKIHDLRHTTASSLAVQAGANVKAIQRMLGHASAAMTLDVYADLFDDDLDAVSAALDRSRSSQLGGARHGD
ncbi:site-specific integrase [Microbacterium sp. zg-B185]|uniref:tyrosine-type recombinase/integrase n=1 Tax=Microbacterium sp. zg-B185 TaxID=3049070 RepID=UPI00254A7F2B|nr:site-specific integrase [Microbacterium sp. zg-B185]WIM20951.1 site-specific integrase [Microbacterium sp. zg-B185]WIM20953.1 site-specific integrase [Microbacterium sp. zg-B185]